MSHRTKLGIVESTVRTGEAVDLFRDYDTKTYRLFTYEGHRTVKVGGHTGHQFDTCSNCDFSIDDLKALAALIQRAIDTHEPWPNYDVEEP